MIPYIKILALKLKDLDIERDENIGLLEITGDKKIISFLDVKQFKIITLKERVYMRVNRKELSGLLGITTNNLKQIINRGQLEDKLMNKGYKLIEIVKIGRTFLYEIVEVSSNKNVLSGICENVFEIKNVEEFSEYLMYRITNTALPVSKEEISNKVGVSRKTTCKWDNSLLKNDVIKKDGYFYIAIDITRNDDGSENRSLRITDKHEFTSYMKNSRYAGMKRRISEKYKVGEIDYDTFVLAIDGVVSNQQANEDKFVYRINKYTRVKDNKLLKDIAAMIKEVSGKNFWDYYLRWDESIMENRLVV